MLSWLIDWVIDRSIDWLVDWLVDWLIDWVIDWLIDWLTDWLIDWLSSDSAYIYSVNGFFPQESLGGWLQNWTAPWSSLRVHRQPRTECWWRRPKGKYSWKCWPMGRSLARWESTMTFSITQTVRLVHSIILRLPAVHKFNASNFKSTNSSHI